MNHPMYKDRIYAKAYEGYKKKREQFDLMTIAMGEEAMGLRLHMKVMEAIEKNGHVLVDIESDEWRSDITDRTLRALSPKDVKFPFKAGAIMAGKSNDEVVFFSVEDNELIVSFEVVQNDGSTGVMSQTISMDTEFGEFFDMHPDNKEQLSMTISVLMYISAFKREKARVLEVTTNKLKASKKRAIPSHRIHTVYVRQPKSSGASHKQGGEKKSDKSWLVRGHWRNQYYKSKNKNAPKWIDPYWKGDGKEKLEKVYKV